MISIYGDSISGNCLKVLWTARHVGVAYDWHEIDVVAGETRTPEFLRINPAGQVPAVVLQDGRTLAQSNAIIRWLAAGTSLLPADPYAAAKVDEWLFWEQYSHEPYIAVGRFQVTYLGKPAHALEPRIVERGNAALDHMEATLADRDWFAGGQASIADIALVAYTRVAHEGGFDLSDRPRLRAWIARVEEQFSIVN